MIKTCLVLLVLNGVRAQVSFSSIPCRQRIPKIVGGIQAKEHEMPFIVSLMRRGGHFCGGNIIHERWVLTAGHCICNGLNKFLKPTQIHGVAGLHSISKYQNGDAAVSESVHPKEISFKSIVPHPNYECTKVKNDIALLELLHPVTFSEHIQPTCLSVDVPLKNHENQLATVSGWGWTKENQEDGHRADVLRKAAVKIWNNNLCEKSYKRNGKPNNSIEETQLCAGFENGGTDSCWADSGGPLIVNKNVLIGVVSTGIGCARPGLPGIYTRVSKYTDWIGSVLQNSS